MSLSYRFIWTPLAENQLRDLGLSPDFDIIKKTFEKFNFESSMEFGVAEGEESGRSWYHVVYKVGHRGVPSFEDGEVVGFLFDDDDDYGLPTSILVRCTKLLANEQKMLPEGSVTVGLVDGVKDARFPS